MPKDPAFQMTIETWWIKLSHDLGIPSVLARRMTGLIWGIVSYAYQLGYNDGQGSRIEDQPKDLQ